MGGYYSTRWNNHTSKCTVEDCLTFDLKTIPIADYITADEPHIREHYWNYTGETQKIGSIGILFDTKNVRLIFVYQGGNDDTKQSIREPIQLSTQARHLGGVQYFIHCPHCNRRCRTLHKPPSEIHFRCRQCWNLSYRSAQSAHSNDRGAFLGLRMVLDTEDKLDALHKKLSRTRSYRGYPSRAYKRLNRKLELLYNRVHRQLDEVKSSMGKQRLKVGKALEAVDAEAAKDFLATG